MALDIFIPITKVDVPKRLVYGIATGETEDASGEICHYETTKPLYEKWSEEFSKATDGKSLGNLRSMHGPVAAGKLTQINFNDDEKQIEICAKVVDDVEWGKVLEGVYTGFSQGGSYVKRWKDPDTGKQFYTADPAEVSLVDRPCLPTATFEMIKADGVIELRKFNVREPKPMSTFNDQIVARATELANQCGGVYPDFIEAAINSINEMNKQDSSPKATVVEIAPAVAEAYNDDDLDGDGIPDNEQSKEKKDALLSAVASTNDCSEVTHGKNMNPTMDKRGRQVWQSEIDGSIHFKKADMIAHHEQLEAAEEVAKSSTGADQAIAAAKELINKRKFSADERKKDAKSGAAEKNGSFPIENGGDLRNAIHAYGRANDKAAAKSHIIQRAKDLGLTDLLPKGWDGSTKKFTDIGLSKFEKGLPTCARLACLIEELHTVKHAVWMEAKQENDDSPLPMMLHQNIDDICATLKMMVEEETTELTQGQDVDDLEQAEWDACFANFVALPEREYAVMKEFIPREMSDMLIEARTVAKLEKIRSDKEAEALAKSSQITSEEYQADLRKERLKTEGLLKKQEEMSAQMLELLDLVKEMAAQPIAQPMPMTGRVVEKSAEEIMHETALATQARRILENPDEAFLHFAKNAKGIPVKMATVSGF